MRRIALVLATALGSVLCLLGGTVLFSALQDTARTGTNSAESGALGASADIQLARATLDAQNNLVCGTFSDDLATGLFSAASVSPGYLSAPEYVCVKNVGSQQVSLTALSDELVDIDVACTGDEAANGDSTCGGDLAGELSDVLRVSYSTINCASGSSLGGESQTLKQNTTIAALLGTLAPSATSCHVISVDYPAATPNADVQKAQSDRVTWRFRFSGQV